MFPYWAHDPIFLLADKINRQEQNENEKYEL